jgi:dimethylaniline monooxygenase (N-oxide forming)
MLINLSALFFTASTNALHGNEEFLRQLYSGELIKVHRSSITSITGSTVSLSNGETVPADAVVFATGWDFKSTVFEPSVADELGISIPLADQDSTTAKYWNEIDRRADTEVLNLLPRLKNPPPFSQRVVKHTPTRLYRYVLPSSLAEADDHSLIFLGLMTNVQTAIHAEVSALWGVAWMEGLLEKIHTLPGKPEMDYEIAKVNAWCSRRYLSRGATRQIASVEVQQVVDLLMRDMGLEAHRKGNWVTDTFTPYRSQDYKGIVKELVEKVQKRDKVESK